jgi:hypothetical protein
MPCGYGLKDVDDRCSARGLRPPGTSVSGTMSVDALAGEALGGKDRQPLCSFGEGVHVRLKLLERAVVRRDNECCRLDERLEIDLSL